MRTDTCDTGGAWAWRSAASVDEKASPRTCTIVEGGKPCGEPILVPDVCYDHAIIDPDDADGGPVDPRKVMRGFDASPLHPLMPSYDGHPLRPFGGLR